MYTYVHMISNEQISIYTRHCESITCKHECVMHACAYIQIIEMVEGSLEVKLPTVWTDEGQRWEESEKRRRKKTRENQRRERVRRKKMQVCEKVEKSRKHCVFFLMICGSGGLKSRLAKGSQLARWEMKNCTPLWREAHFEDKMYKTHQVRTTFGSWHVEKVHAIVARNTFRRQNVQNTSASEHF